jgi:UDP-glucuronate 4-epimerase
VRVFGDGSSARDYTYVDDVVDGTYAACLAVRPGRSTVYNLGGSHTTPLLELLVRIGEALGQQPRLVFEPDQPGDVPLTYADITRAARDLGYRPQVPIEEGLRRFVAWYRAEGRRSDTVSGARSSQCA